MIELKYIPTTKLVPSKKEGTNFCLNFEQPKKIIVTPSKGLTVISQTTGYVRTRLIVTSNGQTQFNIFSQPLGEHWLVVSGVEEYEGVAYEIQNVSGNWRLVWINPLYSLKIGMELIFVKQQNN